MTDYPLSDKSEWLRAHRTPTWRLWLYGACFLFGVSVAPSAIEHLALQHFRPETAAPSQYTVIEKIALHRGGCQ